MGEDERGLRGHVLQLFLGTQGNGMTHGTELSKDFILPGMRGNSKRRQL